MTVTGVFFPARGRDRANANRPCRRDRHARDHQERRLRTRVAQSESGGPSDGARLSAPGPLIEEGWLESPITDEIIMQYLRR